MKKQHFFLILALILTTTFTFGQKKTEPLTVEQFENKLKQAGKNAQLLDARSYEEYVQNHLSGAVSFAVNSSAEFKKESAKLDKNKPVFIYSITNGTRSNELARQLAAAGFKEILILPGGLSQWIGLGKPVISTVGEGYTPDTYSSLLHNEKLVLVNFSSRYCGSCKKLSPAIDSISKENEQTLEVIRIEAYENKVLARQLGIFQLPTLLLYKKGHLVGRQTGVIPKFKLERLIREQSL